MANSVAKVIYQELRQINKVSLYLETAEIVPVDEDSPLELKIFLTPQDGFYAGGRFEFLMKIPETYPNKPPSVTCKTRIYHPNIDFNGKICFNMLSESNPSYRIEHYVNGLLFLLQNPNLESRLNSKVTSKLDQFRIHVIDSMMGRKVNGTTFPKVLIRELTYLEQIQVSLDVNSPSKFVLTLFKQESEISLQKLLDVPQQSPEMKQEIFQIFPHLSIFEEKNISASLVLCAVKSVLKRSAKLNVSPNSVVKEMVVLIDNKPAMILVNGLNTLCPEKLSEVFNAVVTIPRSSEAVAILQKPFRDSNAFNFISQENIFILSQVLNEPVIYTASGFPHTLLKLAPQDLFHVLPHLKLLDVPTNPPKLINDSPQQEQHQQQLESLQLPPTLTQSEPQFQYFETQQQPQIELQLPLESPTTTSTQPLNLTESPEEESQQLVSQIQQLCVH